VKAALRTNAHSLVYGVTEVQAVLAQLNAVFGSTCKPVNLRGDGARSTFEAALLKGAAAPGPVVVLVGAHVRDEARGALDAVLERSELTSKAVFALTAAGAVTPELGSLFPLQLAQSSVLGETK
jgi:hypothetical protein